MNRVVIIGRLTKDMELRFTPGKGTPVGQFSVAVENYNSSTKEKGADFIPVILWGKSAENLSAYLLKGTLVAISGKIATRKYVAKDGTNRYVTEVVADMSGGVKLLGGKKTESVDNTYSGETFDDGMTPVDDGDMPF